MTPETHKRSALYMLAHDEWCSHDETDDGIPCDCHLSVIATLRARLVQMERALADRDRRIDEGDAIPASFYKRLEAADLTIGTLQADRIKAQATIDHYRTMLEAAEKVRLAAQAFVDAPVKFGIRHKAYTQMRKALEEAKG